MEIRQRLTVRPAESNVSAELLNRSARFDSADHIAPRQVLVLKAYMGLREYAYCVQAAKNVP
jgi:hypothetical protein